MFTEYNPPRGGLIPRNAPSERVKITRSWGRKKGPAGQAQGLPYVGCPVAGGVGATLAVAPGPTPLAYRNAATVARVLFSTRSLSLCVEVPMGTPL